MSQDSVPKSAPPGGSESGTITAQHLEAEGSGLRFLPYGHDAHEECIALFDENCPAYFAPVERADYEAFLSAGPPGYTRCELDGETVAAFGLDAVGGPGRGRLAWIMVSTRSQGRGVGAAMMREVSTRAASQGIDTVAIAASHLSAPFFARYGATVIRETVDGWGPGMHRIDMEWEPSAR